jgi:acyl-CoA synthetase (NDP forming)
LELAGDPVDVGAQAGPEEFAAAVREALLRDDVDALIVVFVPPLAVPGTAFARELREVAAGLPEGQQKPIVSTFLAAEGVPAELAVPGPDGAPGRGSIPSYPSPERAALALARVTRYARWRSAPRGKLVHPQGTYPLDARDLVQSVIAEGGEWLTDAQAVQLLTYYGSEVAPFRVVTSADEAARAAEELGFPVAAKSANSLLRHRFDLSAVRLDVSSAEAMHAAYTDLQAVSGADTVYVQRMVARGTSCVIGLQDDPSFGTLVSFGLSGVVNDLLGDRAYRAIPMTDVDAAGLVRAPKAAPLLAGYGGSPLADLGALEDLVLRVAALAEDVPEVRTLELEPVVASEVGANVVYARVAVGPPPSRHDTGPRRLRTMN